MDYQKTVNLPQTDFAMKAGLTEREPKFLERWEKEGLHEKLRAKAQGSPKFTLHDGPPYANGNIHIGHALNKILKDFIVKMKTMQGMDALYVPGWDCHGLPIEHQLLKDLKKRKSEVDCLSLRKGAYEYAMKFVGVQREQFKRLGIFGEWDKPYLTLTPEYEYWILDSLSRLAKDGYVYRGLKPVNWCASCETALAEAEVDYENHSSPSVYVKFRVNNPERLSGAPSGKPLYLVIWTTTPWTLLANVAVAVHPSFTYAVIEAGEEALIIEQSLAAGVLAKSGAASSVVVATVSGRELKGLTYDHPFGMTADCRVITVDYVTKEDGTGLVHTAPGHGQEDFQAGLQHKLTVLMPVDDRGVFVKEAGKFAGQHIFKANDQIIEDLRGRGILLASEKVQHSYPHCWRCKNPIIFRATHQWFLSIDHKNLRDKLKKAIREQVEWIPSAGQERILGMINTRPDWCLSRQRYWGVPIPAIACRTCGGDFELYPEVVENFAALVRKNGSDVWFEKELKDILPKGFHCPKCGKNDFERSKDILDVWFDSGVSHQAVIAPMLKQELPVEMYLEGSDQHRGWFQSSLIPSVAMDGRPPYRAVLTHGFVVDGQGRKMSKSLGNVISPLDVIKTSGADILRLWVASSSYNDDIRLSKEILDRLVDAYRKIRNTFRYLLGNLNGFDPDKDQLPYDQLLDIDKWVLERLRVTLAAVKQGYNAYDFSTVYKGIYAFCNEDLSTFYLDILKDRLYTSSAKSMGRRSAQTVLYHILNHLVRVLAPLMTFTAEEIFEAMPKDSAAAKIKSVHLADWLAVPDIWHNPSIDNRFKLFLELRPHVLKALEEKRRSGEIGGSLEAKVVFESASQRDIEYLTGLKKDLPGLLIVSQAEVHPMRNIEQGVGDSFSQTRINIARAEGFKCGRCWNFSVLVGKDQEHPALCERCVPVVKEWSDPSLAHSQGQDH